MAEPQFGTAASRQGAHEVATGALSLTLARLTAEFLNIADRLTDIDPSDSEGLARIREQLDRSAAGVQAKAGSIAALIREFEARADIAQAEADRIAAHARAARSRASWLRDYLLGNLESLGVERIQTATALVAVREGPPAAEVLDEELLPEAFKRIVRSVDKAQLRRALLDGEVIPGARLTRGRCLLIR